MRNGFSAASYATIIAVLGNGHATAQEFDPTYSFFGTPDLLETPTAQSAAENELAASVSLTEGLVRTTFSFQINPKLSASFRYVFADLHEAPPETGVSNTFERGLDLQYRFNDQTTYVPAFAIGLRDLLSPGRLSSEYLVASKTVGDKLTVSAGVGWGQLAGRDGFANPFGSGDRPTFDEDDPGGRPFADQWFKGDAAYFGGLEYQLNDRWGFKAEYSSITYPDDAFNVAIPVESPFNFGVSYRPRADVQLGLAYLYGTQIGLTGTVAINPNNRPGKGGLDSAPAPIKPRLGDARAATTWDRSALPEPALRSALTALLDIEGIRLTGLEVTDRTARVRYQNNRYRSEAQAMGRVARMMTQIMPPSVEVFVLEPERRGIPLSSTRIARSDLERLENKAGSTDALLASAGFDDAGGADGLERVASPEKPFSWGLGPYLTINPFSPRRANKLDFGLSLRGRYQLRPNVVLSGAIGQSFRPAEDDLPRTDSTPNFQNVRTDGFRYGRDGVPTLQSLAVTHFARPGTNLFSRVSFGYLERMFGGISSELLWKPVDSRLGLGIALNYVSQRDADMAFGFDEYDYQVATGHVSAYYDIGNGYHTQVDVGRYLAGDWGATVALDREFNNGWRVGAYFSRTDMSFEDFGEGSYNKGVRITIPQDFFTGSPTRSNYTTTFNTSTRDGGARLDVDGRLYEIVRDGHQADLSDTWGRFWR